MDTSKQHLPFGLKAVIGYFIVAASVSLLSLLLYSGPQHAEFAAKPLAYKLGSRARGLTFDALFLCCGIGLLRRRAWARKVGLWTLAASAFYSAYAFAWGFAHGRPSPQILAMSLVIVGAWSAIWFSLLYRRSSAEALR